MNAARQSVPPPAAIPATPFTVAAHRAFNDALEARMRDPEAALRRARAEIDAALAVLAAGTRKRGSR